ncbi:hypothetical protein [Lacticaseibacillus paracasei]|uniref:hypothetical protein n=1 Tax=Lacticaseibacillus paracasei TaxID=1597 RepID=UPI00039A8AE5|nr:hypothetical protein [Lacticaseibacillus paracasei]
MNKRQISEATYKTLQTKYAKYGSWALWQQPTTVKGLRKAECGIDSFTPQLASATFRQAHLTNAGIVVALNWAGRGPYGDTAWVNFHDTRSTSQDYKVAQMLVGTPFEGSYMTDAIKNFPETNGATALKTIKQPENAAQLATNAAMLQNEIDLIQPQYLIIFGHAAEDLVNFMQARQLLQLNQTQCVEIDHYAASLSYETMAANAERLRQLPLV